MKGLDLQAVRNRDERAPDYGPAKCDDETKTSHELINAFRDRRALLVECDRLLRQRDRLGGLLMRIRPCVDIEWIRQDITDALNAVATDD